MQPVVQQAVHSWRASSGSFLQPSARIAAMQNITYHIMKREQTVLFILPVKHKYFLHTTQQTGEPLYKLAKTFV